MLRQVNVLDTSYLFNGFNDFSALDFRVYFNVRPHCSRHAAVACSAQAAVPVFKVVLRVDCSRVQG